MTQKNRGRNNIFLAVFLLSCTSCFLNLSSADESPNEVISAGKTCPEARRSTCQTCDTAYGIIEDQCCSDEVMYTLCNICIASPEKCFPELFPDQEDLIDEDKRAKYFLGKRGRSSYFLGKRPRNNFLGKRSDELGMSDEMWDGENVIQSGEDTKRRLKPFLGKRRQPFLGKRAKYFLGKREDDNTFDMDEDKRARYFLGKRFNDVEDDLDEEKRAKYFLGKRAKYFLGKRAKYFLGKREDDSASFDDEITDMKRAKYFLGKRRQHFLGKRDTETMNNAIQE